MTGRWAMKLPDDWRILPESCASARGFTSELVLGDYGSFDAGGSHKFDSVAFRVREPAEPPVVILFNPVADGNAFGTQRIQHFVQVVHAVVKHERLWAWLEVFGIVLENRPHREPGPARIICFPPREHDTRRVVPPYTQVLLIPAVQGFRIVCFEKHTAQTSDTLHKLALRSNQGSGLAATLGQQGTVQCALA